MKTMNTWIYSLLFFFLACAIGFANDSPNDHPLLEANKTYNATLELTEGQLSYVTFRFRVDPHVYAYHIELSQAQADLDIYVKHNEDITSYDDVDAAAFSDAFNETLSLSRTSTHRLQDGYYYIDVCYQLDTLPTINNVKVSSLSFAITITTSPYPELTTLREGNVHSSVLLPENKMFEVYSVDVPRNAEALRVDIFNAHADIDLFISRDAPAYDSANALYSSETLLSSEHIVIDRNSTPRLQAGTYYITVVDQVAVTKQEKYSILVNFSSDTPELLTEIQGFPPYASEMEKAILATVEISSEFGRGTGTLISPDGYLLTSYHVISENEKLATLVNVGINLNIREAATEMFQARVIEYDKGSDFVLLKISSGLYGQALPQDYVFPYFAIASIDDLSIGQPLSILGFPGIGGIGSRVSVSLTRGILSGFEATSEGIIIKTDAVFNVGSSGGPVFTVHYELVGLASAVVGEDSSQLGFVHSVDMLPKDWLQLLRR